MPNSRLFVLLPLSLVFLASCSKREPAIAEGHDVQFRLSSREPYGSWVETVLPMTGETVYMDPEPVLTGTDIYHVSPSYDEYDEASLRFKLWPEAAERLNKFTEVHDGRQLVIVVNGAAELVYSIDGPFGERFIISGRWKGDEVWDVWDTITGRGDPNPTE